MDPAAVQAGGMLNLEKELVCFICTEILFQPLTLIDCLHTFCGSCLKSWFQLQHHKACSSSHASSSTNPYTCPTCRATVKTARSNAMVNTWLELYLAANPTRAPSQEDKEEKSANYKPGDDILPKVVKGRRRERRHRRDDEDAIERRMLEEARQRSLQETQSAPPPLPPRQNSLQPNSALPDEQQSRSRDRDRDREREERRARRREAERQRRQRVQAEEQEMMDSMEGGQDEEHEYQSPALPPTSSPRHPNAVEERQRQQRVMHQASLVSLISSSEGTTGSSIVDSLDENALRDLILAEGLYDNIDINGLTEAEQDVLADLVARRFRRWQQGRHEGGTPETALPTLQITASDLGRVQSENAGQIQTRTRSRSTQRRSDSHPPPGPTIRATSRPRSSRTFPSESTTMSTNTAPTAPIALPPSSIVLTQRGRRHSNQSQSNVSVRTRSRQSSPKPSSNQTAHQSVAISTNPSSAIDISTTDTAASIPVMTRSNTELHSPPPVELPDNAVIVSTHTSPAITAQELPAIPINETSITSPRSSGAQAAVGSQRTSRSASRTLSQSGLQPQSFFDEPSITCFRCSRIDIQYEIHKYCESCNVSLCLSCYRRAKGCKYWFGFGDAAMIRFNQQPADRRDSEQVPFPHELVGRSLRMPHRSLIVGTKLASDGVTTLPTRTMSDPARRMQEGYFCDRCQAFANTMFYSCYKCNSGEWGFCKDCVNTHHCCTHDLRPITQQSTFTVANRQPAIDGSLGSPASTPGEAQNSNLMPVSLGHSQPTSATSTISNLTGPRPGFAYLQIRTNCDQCGILIDPTYLRYHCPFHFAPDATGVKALGNYDICTQCYHGLVKSNRIKRDDGPAGWRRCPSGHRMIITKFKKDPDGGFWRAVDEDLVGGRDFSEETMKIWMELLTKQRDGNHATSDTVDLAEFEARIGRSWRWRTDQSSDQRTTRQRTFGASSQPPSVTSSPTPPSRYRFPPSGGFGVRAYARFMRVPEEGEAGKGELTFPYNAEIRELERVNEDFWSGVYAGDTGLVPAGYLRSTDTHEIM